MKRIIVALLVLWSGFAVTSSAYAAAQHEQLVTEVLQLSGADALFDSIEFGAGPAEDNKSQDPVEAKVIEVINQPLDVKTGKKILALSASRNLDSQTVNVLLKWYRSPLWMKIKSQKTNAPKNLYDITRLQYLYELKTTPPAPGRIELLKRLANCNRSIEMMHDIMSSTFIALAGVSDNPSYVIEAMEDSFRKNRTEEIEASRDRYTFKCLYDFRTIPDEEIKQYVDFLGTKESMKFDVILFSSVQTWLNETLVKKVDEKVKQLKQSLHEKGIAL